jgi:hypothetical protein
LQFGHPYQPLWFDVGAADWPLIGLAHDGESNGLASEDNAEYMAIPCLWTPGIVQYFEDVEAAAASRWWAEQQAIQQLDPALSVAADQGGFR